jgi:hypothetical protein
LYLRMSDQGTSCSVPAQLCLPEEVMWVWLPAGARVLRTALMSVWLAWDLFQNIWHLTLACPVPPLIDFSGVIGHNYIVIWLMHKLYRWRSCLWFVFNMIWWLNKVTVVVDWQHIKSCCLSLLSLLPPQYSEVCMLYKIYWVQGWSVWCWGASTTIKTEIQVTDFLRNVPTNRLFVCDVKVWMYDLFSYKICI